MFYIKEQHNPNKHPLMPNEYPWIISNEPHGENWIECADIDAIKASIDMSAYNAAVAVDASLERQIEQRLWGLSVIPNFVDKMGKRNFDLISQGNQINITAIAMDNMGLKTLIEAGALKTARSLCDQLKVKYPTHEDVYQDAITTITDFLVERGYE